jgi:hypothetical protein
VKLWRWLQPHLTVPLVVLIVGFTFSAAANIAWSWDGGPIRVLGGLLASLALPGAIHMWPRIPVHGTWHWRNREWPLRRVVRAVVMTLIASLAAVTTFAHASALLIAHGENPALAMAYPVITELVVVMGALAHQAGDTPARHRAKRPASAHDAGRALAETPPKRTPREPLHAVAPVSTAARAREWIRTALDAGRDITGADVDSALGLTGKQRCGARELGKVLAQREAVSA